MIKSDNKVMLIDFGIARTYKEGQSGDTIVLGSRGYIAPEQLMNVQSNIQTDIYSLGATMYFMSTEKTPDTINKVSDQFTNFPGQNSSLSRVIHKALLTETTDRYSRIIELKRDLQLSTNESEYERTRLLQASESLLKLLTVIIMMQSNLIIL
jgi:serine/threonine protein kinase